MRDTYGNMSIPSDRYQAHRRSLNFELMAVGTVLLFLLSLVSGCSLMLFVVLRLGLLGAVCCFVSAVSVRIGCFLPLPAALDLAGVILFCNVGPRSWAGPLSWSAPFGVSCCSTAAAGIGQQISSHFHQLKHAPGDWWMGGHRGP